MMKKIVIIGSDSYIGTKLINTIEKDAIILPISRIPSGKKNELIKKNLFELSYKNFEKYDVIINFAAIVHQPHIKDENIYNKVNTLLPIHLAKEAKKAGIKHFIQMSTIAVYGNIENITINSKEAPDTIYGKSKLSADNSLLSMQDSSFAVSIIRPPMVYGGGNAPGNMQKLIKIALKGFPLPFKNIQNERDFVNVNNLIIAINAIIKFNLAGIILPTDKFSTSTNHLLECIERISNKKIHVIGVPKILKSAIFKLFPSKSKKLFGNLTVKCNIMEEFYKPIFSLEDGIKDMIEGSKT